MRKEVNNAAAHCSPPSAILDVARTVEYTKIAYFAKSFPDSRGSHPRPNALRASPERHLRYEIVGGISREASSEVYMV